MSRITGLILALDLGVTAGFAKGRPRDAVVSGSVRLKKPDQPIDVAFANLWAFLCDQFAIERPELVVKEAMLQLPAFGPLETSQKTIRAHAAYHGIVEGCCRAHDIEWRDASEATVRKHFLGTARVPGGRPEIKKAVIARCHLLGLMPRDRHDDNQADAIATHDWACATFGGAAASIQNFQFFEQEHGGRRNAAGA